VPGHVPVADQHPDVRRQTFGPERCGGEARRHGEEDDRAALRRGEHRRLLAAGDVHTDDRDVRRATGGGHGVGQGERGTRVGDHDLVGEAGAMQLRRLGLRGHHRDPASGAGLPRGSEGQRARFAGPAEYQHQGWPAAIGALPDHPADQRRRPADVHHHQRQRRGEVVRHPGGDRATEQDRMTLRRHPLAAPVPATQAVGDPQWGQRQGDQCGDPVPHHQPEWALRADGLDGPKQHASGPGDRVLHLAAAAHDVKDRGPDGAAVDVSVWRPVNLGELPVRRGVQVEDLHGNAHLVRPDLGTLVQPLRRLRQHGRAGAPNHPVQSERRARPGRTGLGGHER